MADVLTWEEIRNELKHIILNQERQERIWDEYIKTHTMLHERIQASEQTRLADVIRLQNDVRMIQDSMKRQMNYRAGWISAVVAITVAILGAFFQSFFGNNQHPVTQTKHEIQHERTVDGK